MVNKLNLELDKVDFNGGFKMDDYWVWCGSVIKGDDNKYHLFASRWSKDFPMDPGWLFASEIVRATSNSPTGPFEFQEVVLGERGANFWDGRMTHNPLIKKYKDKYLLYYIGLTYPGPYPDMDSVKSYDNQFRQVATSNQKIGLAIADNITGPWTRFDKPILDVSPDRFDNCLVTNPTVSIDDDGHVLMIYKSRRFVDNLVGNKMEFAVAKAESYLGPYIKVSNEPLFHDSKAHLEDPFIWFEDEKYHMIAKDMDGEICGESGAGVYAHSDDGVTWNIVKNNKVYSRTLTMKDGTKRTMSNLERPSIFHDENKSYLVCAIAEGNGDIQEVTDTWNIVIPIKN